MGQAQSTPNDRQVAAPISEKFPNHDNMEDSIMVEKSGESYDGKPFPINRVSVSIPWSTTDSPQGLTRLCDDLLPFDQIRAFLDASAC